MTQPIPSETPAVLLPPPNGGQSSGFSGLRSEADQRLFMTFEQAAIGIAHQTLDEEWLWVNQRFCDILGYSRDELFKLKLEDITHPEDRAMGTDFSRHLRTGGSVDHGADRRYIRKDGSIVWAHLTVSMVRTADGEPSYLVGFLEDATARRLAGQRLAAQYAVARVIADAPVLEGVARTAIEAVCTNLECEAGSLWMIDRDEQSLSYVDGWHEPSGVLEHLLEDQTKRSPRKGEGLVGRVWESGEPALLADVDADEHFPSGILPTGTEPLGSFAFPVTGGGRMLGVMQFFTSQPRRLDNSLLRSMVVIGNEMGQFLERARIEQLAREGEARKTAVVDAALDAIVMIDENGCVTEFNPAAEAMFQYGREDALGKPLIDLIVPPALRRAYRAEFARYVATGQTQVGDPRREFTAMRTDGTEFPVELAIRRIEVDGPPAFTWFIRDITDRKRAEDDLRRSLSLLQATLESTTDGLLVVDLEGRIVSYNHKMAEMWGIPPEILASGDDERALRIAVNKLRNPGAFLTKVRALYDEPDAESFDLLELKDGRTFERYSQPQRISGHSVGRVWSFRDVTERMRAEAQAMALAEEQAARAAAEASRERAAFLDEASRTLSSSFDSQTTLAALVRLAVPALADYCTIDLTQEDGSFVRVSGAHVDSAAEPLLITTDPINPADVTGDYPALRVLADGEPVLMSETSGVGVASCFRRESARHAVEVLDPHSLICVPLVSSERTLGVLTLAYSISGRRYRSADLALATELARRAAAAIEHASLYHAAQLATRAREDILAVVAHDLRNPLNTIVMAAELLIETASSGKKTERRHVEILLHAGRRMNRMIQDLLDVQRMESGRLTVERKPEDVGEIVRDTIELLHPIADGSGITLEFEIPGGLPRVSADAARVQQVLSNLIGNALKFTPRGGRITIRATQQGRDVRVCVRDTGPGIPAEQLPHIFGRFWQAAPSDNRGLGIGLAIAKGIVEAHGGRIWVESTPGEGSSFLFTLPAVI